MDTFFDIEVRLGSHFMEWMTLRVGAYTPVDDALQLGRDILQRNLLEYPPATAELLFVGDVVEVHYPEHMLFAVNDDGELQKEES